MPRQLNATAGGETGTAALDPAPAVAATAVETTRASGVTAPSVTPVRSGGGPVTPMMARLDLTGESVSALGNPRAPMTVVEFSDYGCPFCRRYVSSAFPQIKAAYIDSGKVYYVFKDLPIVQAHPQAALAAEAARCAGDQSKYWEMHAALFAAPSEWDTTVTAASAAFAGYASQIGLDPAAFGACMADRRYQASVAANLAQGRHLGLTGTPSFIVDGKLLAGEYPFSVFQTAFDHELEAIAGGR